MSINVILQARLSSTRLPGKVLKNIVNQPMLALQIERVKTAKLIDKIVIATSTEQEDDAIDSLCKKLDIACFRGNLNDVLDRFYQTAKEFPSDHIVRLTGDCPLIEPNIIDQVIALHLEQVSDYTSNCFIPCLPDGLDVEVFTTQALAQSWKQAKKPSEREHVTQYIRNHSEMFTIVNFQYTPDLSMHRWTVDEPSDFKFVKNIYQHLYPSKPNFTMKDILTLLEQQPNLIKINNEYNRNQGLISSKAFDKEQGFE
jgi:spore coat polysaccharide biosynthesis protein SpsF